MKNPIIEIDEKGVVLSVESCNEIDKEANVEFYNGVIIPGMINCHNHLEYSYVKGMIPPGGGLGEFIRSIIEIKIKQETPESDMIDAAKCWDGVMAAEGVVAVGDHNNNDYVYGVKRDSKVEYINFIELFDMDGKSAEETFYWGKERMEESRSYGFKSSIVPHANYTMEQDLIDLTGGDKATSKGESADGIVSVHFKESLDLGGDGELEAIFQGLSSKRDRVLLVHSIYAAKSDIQKMQSKLGDKISVVMCPKSNLYIENNMADYNMLKECGVVVALGTDSLSSNTELSMVKEMLCFAERYKDINLTEIVDLATINGAKTLCMEDKLGSVEVGKCPGLVLIDGIDFENMRLTTNSKGRRII